MNSQMSSQISLAFTLANGFATELITLAVAMIGFTVTFAKDFQQNNVYLRWLLIIIWALLLASVFFGIFDIKAIITILAPLNASDKPIAFSENALWWATRQEVLFFIGMFLFIIQGVISIFSKRTAKDEVEKRLKDLEDAIANKADNASLATLTSQVQSAVGEWGKAQAAASNAASLGSATMDLEE